MARPGKTVVAAVQDPLNVSFGSVRWRMTLRLIRVAGFVAWFISTVGGGRGEFIYILAIAHLLGAQAVAPVVTFGNLLGVPSRIYLFRHHIDWRIVRWFLSGAVPGAILQTIAGA